MADSRAIAIGRSWSSPSQNHSRTERLCCGNPSGAFSCAAAHLRRPSDSWGLFDGSRLRSHPAAGSRIHVVVRFRPASSRTFLRGSAQRRVLGRGPRVAVRIAGGSMIAPGRSRTRRARLRWAAPVARAGGFLLRGWLRRPLYAAACGGRRGIPEQASLRAVSGFVPA